MDPSWAMNFQSQLRFFSKQRARQGAEGSQGKSDPKVVVRQPGGRVDGPCGQVLKVLSSLMDKKKP